VAEDEDIDPSERALACVAAFAARGFAAPAEAVAAILGLTRDLLGVSTALVVRVEGGEWLASHVDDDAFGLAPGAVLPLSDTF